ncbi:MAG TPA: hypothetical protein VF526_05680 [Solirubrobacteraceae bacterium]
MSVRPASSSIARAAAASAERSPESMRIAFSVPPVRRCASMAFAAPCRQS